MFNTRRKQLARREAAELEAARVAEELAQERARTSNLLLAWNFIYLITLPLAVIAATLFPGWGGLLLFLISWPIVIAITLQLAVWASR